MKQNIHSLLISGTLLCLSGLSALAQGTGDAMLLGENSYFGSARSVAMGNAFTALGGDLGAIGLNPAGSAVASYGQFTITPSVNFATSLAQGVTLPEATSPYCFGDRTGSTQAAFSMPNFGVSVFFDTGRRSGLLGLTFGVVCNATNNFLGRVQASGRHIGTSYLGALAEAAQGYNVSAFQDYEGDAPADLVLAHKAGLIYNIKGENAKYVGATEHYVKVPDYSRDPLVDSLYDVSVGGPLQQRYDREVRGGKRDYIFNLGFNIDDRIYLGANLGLTSVDYRYLDNFREEAVSTEDFRQQFTYEGKSYETCWQNMRMRYSQTTSGMGAYGKFGVLYVPLDWLRLGAAVQTPTGMSLKDTWSWSAESRFTDSFWNASGSTPDYSYAYRLITPWRFNAGVAAVLFKRAIVSVDYETCDYGSMKFKARDSADDGVWDATNEDIRSRLTFAHNLRIGAEFKASANWAVRAGWNIRTSPERGWRWHDSYRIYSLGAGYDSGKSFFADLALRYKTNPESYTTPYANYMTADDGSLIYHSPEFRETSALWSVLLTLGFRF